MRFVKRIFGKIHHGIEDAVGRLRIDPLGCAPGDIFIRISGDEIRSLHLHDMLLLFAHGTSDQIRPAKRISA